jgi:hypothetical protein
MSRPLNIPVLYRTENNINSLIMLPPLVYEKRGKIENKRIIYRTPYDAGLRLDPDLVSSR